MVSAKSARPIVECIGECTVGEVLRIKKKYLVVKYYDFLIYCSKIYLDAVNTYYYLSL